MLNIYKTSPSGRGKIFLYERSEFRKSGEGPHPNPLPEGEGTSSPRPSGAPKVGNPLSGKPNAELTQGLGVITSDLPACGLSRMASCFINDTAFLWGYFGSLRSPHLVAYPDQKNSPRSGRLSAVPPHSRSELASVSAILAGCVCRYP